jgi:Domain of unknown function (DUF5911)
MSAARGQSQEFRPIAAYGLLADCNSAALVDRDGSIGWLCLPRYDSAAVFAQILDPDGGHWTIRPAGGYRVERRYLPGTLVIETTFTTATGRVQLTDAMAFAEGQRGHDLGFESPHLLLRSVVGVEGEVELSFELAPRPEYGLVKPLFRATESGGRTFGGPNQIVVSAGVETNVEDATMRARFTVSAGEKAGFALPWCHPRARVRIPSTPSASPPDSGHGRRLVLLGGAARHLQRTPPRPGAAQLARAQGPDLPADGGDRGRAHHLAAGDGGRGAQLGLPLLLDP